MVFRYWLGRKLEDDERQINRWEKSVSRFRGKFVKMIRDAGTKFQFRLKLDRFYCIGVTNEQKKYFFNELSNYRIKMSYYWFNRQDILQKAKERYSKEKAAKYYAQNKETIKEKSRERYKNLSQEEKDKIKEYQKKYQELVQYKKEALKNK